MEDIGSILVVIAMFAVPVLGAVIVKKLRRNEADKMPQVDWERIFDEDGNIVADGDKVKDDGKEAGRSGVKAEYAAAKKQPMFNEGERAVTEIVKPPVILEEEPQRDKLKIDKRNLIIYSELLKPKFDERI